MPRVMGMSDQRRVQSCRASWRPTWVRDGTLRECRAAGSAFVDVALPHEAIIVEPDEPTRTMAPPTTPTAVGTLISPMLLRTSDPASTPLDTTEERTKMGVLETTA